MAEFNFNITIIKNLAPEPLITFTSNRISDMGSCVAFLPSPTPTIAGMTTLRDTYQAKEADYKKIPSDTNRQDRDDAYDALIAGHLSWIAYGKPLIGDNMEHAILFGYPLYADRTPATVPEGVPNKPTFKLTPNPGQVVLVATVYKQGTKAIYYQWQISDDDGVTYSDMASIGNSHRRKTTLSLGVPYKVRVAYATTAGAGPYSDWMDITLTKDTVGKAKKAPKPKL